MTTMQHNHNQHRRIIMRNFIPRFIAASAVALALAAQAALPAAADTTTDAPLTITVKASDESSRSLKGRRLSAYKLAEYVDGTYVSVGDEALDGVAVNTPDQLKTVLNPVLARTTGVGDVAELPRWKLSGEDPIAWMGGFRQNEGSDQSAGAFGFGWNPSGRQGMGNNSTRKAYVGSVREFADHLVRDDAAWECITKQPHASAPEAGADDKAVTIPLGDKHGSGIYLVVDDAQSATWREEAGAAEAGVGKVWNTGVSQPMIVPTQPEAADLATLDGHAPSDRTTLGTVGKLGEVVIKNTTDSEIVPEHNPKQRDEEIEIDGRRPGVDAADNASDIGDVVPYVLRYMVPDLSAYKAASDNALPWAYHYRVIDRTTPGLSIDAGTARVTIENPQSGKTQELPLTEVERLPDTPKDGQAGPEGQPGEPEAWVHVEQKEGGGSNLTIGLGRWLVRNYGDIAANDATKTLYGAQLAIRYTAHVDAAILDNGNHAHNENWVEYSNNPSDVTSGKTVTTPHAIVRQWTYDLDLVKRSSTSDATLAGARFEATVERTGNKQDAKRDGEPLSLVSIGDGIYRHAAESERDRAVGTVVTGSDGRLSIRGLDLGSVTLRETASPENYQTLPQAETFTISAKFTDDPSTWTTPDAQTEATLTITQRNAILPLKRPMLHFALTPGQAPTGMTLTATSASWSGKDETGAWVADDKTSWLDVQLVLWNQPNNVMLAATGADVNFAVALLLGVVFLCVGMAMLMRAGRGKASGRAD